MPRDGHGCRADTARAALVNMLICRSPFKIPLRSEQARRARRREGVSVCLAAPSAAAVAHPGPATRPLPRRAPAALPPSGAHPGRTYHPHHPESFPRGWKTGNAQKPRMIGSFLCLCVPKDSHFNRPCVSAAGEAQSVKCQNPATMKSDGV